MATVGSMIVALGLSTVGLSAGLAKAEAELMAFQTRGAAAATAAANAIAAADVKVVSTALAVTRARAAEEVADARVELAEINLASAKAAEEASYYSILSAETRLAASRNSLALVTDRLTAAEEANAAAAAAAAEARTVAALPVPVGKPGGVGGFPMIGAAIGLASVALLAFDAHAVKTAADFQADMLLIQTQANASADEVQNMTEAILQMAPAVQTGPIELSKALFHIESVGISGAQALNTLKLAAQGAAVGHASLEAVTNALVAVQKSGISAAQGSSAAITDMGQAMGILNGIVGSGNVRLQALTASLSSGVLSVAKQFGVSLKQVGAAMATMTDQGIPAEEGATRLRITMALLAAPTKIAAAQLAKIGLTDRAIADEMRGPQGLVGALRLLKTHMDGAGLDATAQGILLKTAFGGSRSSAGIFTLINSLTLMEQKLGTIDEKEKSFNADWEAQTKTTAAAFARLGAQIQVLEVSVGDTLTPVVQALVFVLSILLQQTGLISAVLLTVTAVIGLAAVRAFVNLTASIWGSLAGLRASAIAHIAHANAVVGANAAITQSAATAAAVSARLPEAIAAQTAAMAAVAPSAAAAAAALGRYAQVRDAAGRFTGTWMNLQTGVVSASLAEAKALDVAAMSAARLSAAAASYIPVAGGFMNATTGVITATVAEGVALQAAAVAALAKTEAEAAWLPVAGGFKNAVTGITVATAQEAAAMTAASVAAAELAAAEAAAAAGATTATVRIGLMAGATALLNGALAFLAKNPIVAVILLIAFALMHLDSVIAIVQYAILSLGHAFLTVASWIPVIGDNFKAARDQLQADTDALVASRDAAWKRLGDLDEARKRAQKTSEDQELHPVAAPAVDEASFKDLNATLIDTWGTSMAGVQAAARVAGADQMTAYAKGIADARQAPVDAFKGLTDALAHEMTPAQEMARLEGILESDELARGLASGDPVVVAAAEALRDHTIDRFDQMTDGAYSAAHRVGDSVVGGFSDALSKSGLGKIDVLKAVFGKTDDAVAQASQVANRVGVAVVDSLKDNIGAAGLGFLTPIFEGTSKGLHEALASNTATVKTLANVYDTTLRPSAQAVAAAMEKLRTEFVDGTTDISSAGKRMADLVTGDLNALRLALSTSFNADGSRMGADLMQSLADGLLANQQAPLAAIDKLNAAMTTSMSQTQEVAFLIAALNSQMLAEAFASGNEQEIAQAAAAQQVWEDRLFALTGIAYAGGAAVGLSWSQGVADAVVKGGQYISAAAADAIDKSAANASALKNLLANTNLKQGATDFQKYVDGLAKGASGAASQARSDMTSAFADIKASAMDYFDALHARNLQAITDAHDQKNAILDAKEALNQAPVTAAQKALDFQRKAIEEWRLRKAVAEATDPAARRDAILALQDFLAQKKIDEMQGEVDGAKAVIDVQKKKNDDLLKQQTAAENKRYEQQKKDFARDLAALERYLSTHPGMWRDAQGKIIKLLGKFGVDYKDAGALLGGSFVKGLLSQVAAADAAAKALAAAGAGHGVTIQVTPPTTTTPATPPPTSAPGPVSTGPTGGGKAGGAPIPLALGAWRIMRDNLLATLHKDEMVVPAPTATILRAVGEAGQPDPEPWRETLAGEVAAAPRSRPAESVKTRASFAPAPISLPALIAPSAASAASGATATQHARPVGSSPVRLPVAASLLAPTAPTAPQVDERAYSSVFRSSPPPPWREAAPGRGEAIGLPALPPRPWQIDPAAALPVGAARGVVGRPDVAASGARERSGDTIVVQIGEHVVAEIVDRTLAQQNNIYGQVRVTSGSRR